MELTNVIKHPLSTEVPARENARRSLVAVSHIPKGTIITKEHLTWKRPAHGVSPRDIELVVGSKVVMDIDEDAAIQWNFLS